MRNIVKSRRDLDSESQSPQQDPDEANSLETIERPPSSRSHISQPQERSNPLSLDVLALLIPSSIFGTLARLGLQALGTYDGHSIFPLAYPQAVGCLVMGFALGLKESFGRFYPPAYTALTTGFCGSLTTFSGWQLDVFNAWINAAGSNRSGFRDFIDGTGKSVFTLSISIASVSFGFQIAAIVTPYLRGLPPPKQRVRFILSVLSIASYAAVFPTYFLLPAKFRHQATSALLYAFPGTLTRYLLSIQLNTLLKIMPLGTFTANLTGTALLGVFTVLQNNLSHPVSSDACAILQGLMDGYCGCLTTVSTFAVEVRGMKRWKGFWYVLISWSAGQLLLLVIFGPSMWSGHAKAQRTCTFI